MMYVIINLNSAANTCEDTYKGLLVDYIIVDKEV